MRQPSPTSADYDVLFLKGLLPELRAMNHRQKLRFKCEVYRIVQNIMADSSSPTRVTPISKRRCQRSRHQNRSSNYHYTSNRAPQEESFRYRENIGNDTRTNHTDTNLVSSIAVNMNTAKEEPNIDVNDSIDA